MYTVQYCYPYVVQGEYLACCVLQANKVYPLKNESAGLAGGVKGDPMERAEELARMREEAFREMDQDNDLLVSASEFNRWTHSSQFQDVPIEDDDWLVRASRHSRTHSPLAHSNTCTFTHTHTHTHAHTLTLVALSFFANLTPFIDYLVQTSCHIFLFCVS